MLEVKNLSYNYGKEEILKEITFQLQEGEKVGLVAPSGYGKTTLAKILAGFLPLQKGQIISDTFSFEKNRPHPIQLIPQHPEQAFNPRWKMKKIEKELGYPIPEEILTGLQIKEEWFDRYPHELSGGELQRFSIARTLASRPRYLIADEISTMLDVVTQARIWNYLLNYVKDNHVGLLVMSHNPELLEVTCDRKIYLAELNKRDI